MHCSQYITIYHKNVVLYPHSTYLVQLSYPGKLSDHGNHESSQKMQILPIPQFLLISRNYKYNYKNLKTKM